MSISIILYDKNAKSSRFYNIKLINNLFILFIINLSEFALFLQILIVNKLDKKTIYSYLKDLNIDSIIKLIFILIKIVIVPNNILKIFYKIYIFAK